MEEPKQVTDEPNEAEEEKGVEGIHPPALQQQSPTLITNANTADPNVVPARPLTMAEVRQRMQERYNIDAAAASLKSKEREEKMKEDKQAELECRQLGGSQKLKPQDKSSAAVSTSSSSSSRTSSSVKKKPVTRKRMRPEYNPLMGDTGASSSRWRPSRGPSGGG